MIDGVCNAWHSIGAVGARFESQKALQPAPPVDPVPQWAVELAQEVAQLRQEVGVLSELLRRALSHQAHQ